MSNHIAAPTLDEGGWYRLEGAPSAEDMRQLSAVGALDKLSVTKCKLVTAPMAERLQRLQSVGWLHLWCDVTRAAMRRVIALPGLRSLDVLRVRGAGLLGDFAGAASLRQLRVSSGLCARDVMAITRCPALRELSMQGAALTEAAVEAVCEMPQLQSLDLEGAAFDDQMAAALSRSVTLESLDIGATQVTRRGLIKILEIKQLQALDLWATDLSEDDLELLRALPNLQRVSLGGYAKTPSLDAARIVPLLRSLPALKHVWLDGVVVSPAQEAALRERLESVQVSPPD
jgi:hypothetical protein